MPLSSRLLFLVWLLRLSDVVAIDDGKDGMRYGGIDSGCGGARLLKDRFVENGGEVWVDDGGDGRLGGLTRVDIGGPRILDGASGEVREALSK